VELRVPRAGILGVRMHSAGVAGMSLVVAGRSGDLAAGAGFCSRCKQVQTMTVSTSLVTLCLIKVYYAIIVVSSIKCDIRDISVRIQII
jgi:hypothetical protein